MDLVHPLAEQYAAGYTSPEDELLQDIRRYTEQHHPQAHMLSGPVQGKLLEMISCLLQPQYILEIGSFTGYSALCLAKGLQPGGELHTIELREEEAALSKENFRRAKKDNQIHLHIGNALEIIPRLDFTWDIVFIDADKTGYIEYYELVLPRLNRNGVIIADNVLFHGQVLGSPVQGKSAKAIQAFNEHVKRDERTEQVLVTVRDGLMLIRKKG
jgi:predicted O-methyltransferase YrrM